MLVYLLFSLLQDHMNLCANSTRMGTRQSLDDDVLILRLTSPMISSMDTKMGVLASSGLTNKLNVEGEIKSSIVKRF